MTQERDMTTTRQDQSSQIFHPRFAAFYERYARLGTERRLTDPLPQETAGQAYGTVLEVGAGTGPNCSWDRPEQAERGAAIAPDAATLAYARERVRPAAPPISFSPASAESLPA